MIKKDYSSRDRNKDAQDQSLRDAYEKRAASVGRFYNKHFHH